MIERVFTIGAFGKSEAQFFDKLANAGVDTFCDIRQRRGVRGAEYAFVNSTRLQASLASRGVNYCYVPELAPTQRIREFQHSADEAQGITKRARQELGATFREHYIAEILTPFDTRLLEQRLGPARRIVLFCVEGPASACHRSLVADRLPADWGVPVEHL
jgi:uncharacterized protein (DUF488 family)